MRTTSDWKIVDVSVCAFRVPTEQPESDGTLRWDHTDVVCVEIAAGGKTGLGWTYTHSAAAKMIDGPLRNVIVGRSATEIEACWQAMFDAVRNSGRGGLCAAAISAVDVALWDLKARLLDLSLVDLIGPVCEATPIYGSGGFTSYSDSQLSAQLGAWAEQGMSAVKMKVGRDKKADCRRVAVARHAIGDDTALFVDANGAYSRKEAVRLAEVFKAEADIRWFEEPVSSDDLAGLRLLRDRVPTGMDVAAGEYATSLDDFNRMLRAQAVDCLQIDATRCGGITGFLKAATLAEAAHVPISAHCAPQLHAHVGCCVRGLRHVEYFHDHVRLAPLLFEGVIEPKRGTLQPDRSQPGHGLRLNDADGQQYAI